MIDIGLTLRKLRDKHHHTQQYVANCIEVSRVTYRKWENNEIHFSLSQLSKISDLYDISIDNIIKASYKRGNRF